MNDGYNPEWLNVESQMGGQRLVLSGDLNEMISQYNQLSRILARQWGASSDGVQTNEQMINEHVRVRIYTPRDQSRVDLPVGLYYHGGGFVTGDLDLEDLICRMVVQNTPCVLVSVDYRLAPLNKINTIVKDSYDAFLWAYRNVAKLNGNTAAYFTIGGSAGGALALAVADKLISNGQGGFIRGVVAMNPITAHMDNPPAMYKDEYRSYTENGVDVPIIDRSCIEVFFTSSSADPTNAEIFTAISPNFHMYPAVYIATCEKDVLRDDGVVLENMLKDLGVKVKRDHYMGFPHYFFIFPSIRTSRVFLENLIKGVKFVLE